MAATVTIDPEPYDRLIAARRTPEAVAWARHHLADGADPLDVLGAVAAVQRLVGERWASGAWSVAEEHAATSVALATVEAVDAHVGSLPQERGQVVLACAEREWHAVPALMVAAALRSRGWRVSVLGTSPSVGRFSATLQDTGPDAAAVSCSVLAGLPAARRFIEAARAQGIPVVVGGAAFGSDATRAMALGASAWAADALRAVEAVAGLPTVVAPAEPLDDAADSERAALERGADRLLEQILGAWAAADSRRGAGDGRMGESDARRVLALDGVPVAEDLVQQTLNAVIASLLTGEPSPLHETVAWVTALLAARGASLEHLQQLGDLVRTELRDFPLAQELVREHWV